MIALKRWLAFDIGCIECGEGSAVIGTYDTQEEADAACAVAAEGQERNWSGQHSMESFDLLAAGAKASVITGSLADEPAIEA
jgi:hypothetical protein